MPFKACLAPSYIVEMLNPYEPVRSLRSLGGALLAVPKLRLKSKGDRAFAIRTPQLWNDVPEEIRLAETVTSFNQFLKTLTCFYVMLSFNHFYSFYLFLLSCFFIFFLISFTILIFYHLQIQTKEM